MKPVWHVAWQVLPDTVTAQLSLGSVPLAGTVGGA